MSQRANISPSDLAENAAAAAALMRALSSEHRLLILCHLISAGELAVGQLVKRIELSQSALSQHLAKLRLEGLVDFRREAQTLFYFVADARPGQVLELLRDIFCPKLGSTIESGDSRMAAHTAAPADQSKGG